MAKYSNIGKIFFNDIFNGNKFDGYVILYTSKKDKKTMRKFHYVKANEILTFLEQMNFNPYLNYYFTINTYKNPKGDEKPNNQVANLFGLNGIVIDIDCHNTKNLNENDIEELINKIVNWIFLSQRKKIPILEDVKKF
jgi:hypothetical protein